MSTTENQQKWPDGSSPADNWDAHASKRVLDELLCFARQYRSSKSYEGLLKFVAGFRFYAPYVSVKESPSAIRGPSRAARRLSRGRPPPHLASETPRE